MQVSSYKALSRFLFAREKVDEAAAILETGIAKMEGRPEDKVELIRRTELGRTLGPERLIPTGPRLAEGLERAIRLSREMVGEASDDAIFRTEVGSTWSYQI